MPHVSATNILFLPGVVVNSNVLENSRLISPGAGRLLQIKITNTGPSQYIHFHNKASLPVNGNVPQFIVMIQAGGFAEITDMSFTTGMAVCNSTTAGTTTLGAADCWFYSENK